MNVILSPDIEQRIAEQVRSGRFATPAAVIEAAIVGLTEGQFDSTLDADDVAALNEAESQIDQGQGIELAELRAMMAARMARP